MSVISDKANILITNEDFHDLMHENVDLQQQLAEVRGLLSIAYQLLPDYHDPELVKRHNEIKNYLFPPKVEL